MNATQVQLAGSPRRIAPRDAVRLALENNLRDEMLHAKLKGCVAVAKIVSGLCRRMGLAVFPIQVTVSIAHERESWQAVVEPHVAVIVSGQHLVDAAIRNAPDFVGTDHARYLPRVLMLPVGKDFYHAGRAVTESFGPLLIHYANASQPGRPIIQWRPWRESYVESIVDRLAANAMYRMK